MRAGNRAVIQGIHARAADLGLNVGDRIEMKRRSADGLTWRLSGPGGDLELDHAQADDVIVVLLVAGDS